MLAVLAGGLLVVLAVAAWLTPDPSGIGTHQQLGFPPCTSVSVLGLRCPACGMTTSWALMSEGRISEALRANLGGAMLYLVALVSVPWLAWICLMGSVKARQIWGVFALSGAAASMLMAFALWAWSIATSRF
jgi:hypothetical protein